MIERVKSIFWYVKKGYITHLLTKLRKSNNDNTRGEAIKWCEKYKRTEDEVLRELNVPTTNIEKEHPEYLEFAKNKQMECPIKMGGAGAINTLYGVVKHSESEKIVETGVAYGWSTLAILLGIKDKNAHLYSVDMPYPKLGNECFVGCVVKDDLKGKWTLIRKPDINGIPKIFNILNEIDIFHYDSDKSYNGRMWAYPKIWNKLKEGGIFISDDINDNVAFKHFCEKVSRKPLIFGMNNKFVGVVIK